MTEAWDFDRQRSETVDTLAHLKEEQGVNVGADTIVVLDIFVVPGADADQEALERALAMFGYAGDADESEDGTPTFVVSIPDVALTIDDIWLHEERVAKIALARGYSPDGWGFFEPE